MRIDLTVRHDGHAYDVGVRAAPGTDLAEVRDAVARVCQTGSAALGLLDAPGTWGAGGVRHGSAIDTGAPEIPAAATSGALALHVVGGPNAGRSVPLDRGTLRIGRAHTCGLVLDDADASRAHAAVTVSSTGVTVLDLGSTNGTTVDGERAAEHTTLEAGSLVRIGESLLMLAPPADPPAAVAPGADGTVRVSRPPRRRTAVPAVTVEVPAAALDSRPRAVQWATAVVPLALGGGLAWWTGSLQFLLFTALSPVMIVSGALGDRLHWRRSRRRAAADLARRTAGADAEIAAALRRETAARRAHPPDAATVLRIATTPTDRLWERARHDEDLLRVRLGSGAMPSRTQARTAGGIDRPAGLVIDVPVGVDLRDGPLGLAGPDRLVLGVARHVVGQLAAQCSPADLRVVLLLGRESATRWRWTRWLPHLQSPPAVGTVQWAEVIDELAARPASRPHPGPWTLLVVDGGSTGSAPGLPGLLRDGRRAGITALVLADDVSRLPASCTRVLRPVGDTGCGVLIDGADAPLQPVVADLADERWAERLARALAPLVDGGEPGTAGLPRTCSLRRVHGEIDATTVEASWDRSQGSAAAVVGLGSDGPVELDLTLDGPHALVAGTTGSGKSELLQALVMGLALRQPPSELTVLMIDYKGGAAFAGCARLPHAAGLVTDLDPYLTSRALRSLRSELRRRESLLAAAGSTDLASYRRGATGPPLPRLVIVVDEFAALAEELPEFVSGLVSVAQRGRSLGVHLVLATQRPGSAVSPEIRANTALRIALRVTDAAESGDVLGVADAAAIPRGVPGRAWIRCGSALRAVQTAWPGAVTAGDPDALRVELLDDWRRPAHRTIGGSGPTDLDHAAAAVCAAAARRGEPPARPPWAPVLPDVLPRSALERESVLGPQSGAAAGPVPCRIALGIVDLPDEQRVDTIELDLGHGESLLVVGTSRSGRTGALLSLAAGLAAQLGPDDIEVYVIDPAGQLRIALDGVAHCRTVLDGSDPDLVTRLLTRLEQECTRRGDAPTAAARPMLLLLDGWDALLAALPDPDALQCAALLTSLLRVGPAAGLTVTATGDRTLLAPRVSAGFATRIALRLSDAADYASFGVNPREVPARLPPGRGVRSGDGALVQFATAPDGVGPPDRDAGRAQAGRAQGAGGIRLRPLPRRVRLSDMTAPADRRQWILGVAGDHADPLYLDPFQGAGRILVAGPARSGRSTLLALLLAQAVERGLPVLVVAGARSPLASLASVASVASVASLTSAGSSGVTCIDPHRDGLPEPPSAPTLLLADDCETWAGTPLADTLVGWLGQPDLTLAAVVAGRADDLATTFRGLGAAVRRQQCGVLLRPGPLDGDLLGVRLPRRSAAGPPGRGVVVGDPAWGGEFAEGSPVPVQIALP